MAEAYFEYGYRLPDGREVWAVDHGVDGIWTSPDKESGVGVIDMFDGFEEDAIRVALAEAGVGAVVIRRKVSTAYGAVEVVEADRA